MNKLKFTLLEKILFWIIFLFLLLFWYMFYTQYFQKQGNNTNLEEEITGNYQIFSTFMNNVKNTLLEVWENTWTVNNEFTNKSLSYYTPQNIQEKVLMNEMKELNQQWEEYVWNPMSIDQKLWTDINILQLHITSLKELQMKAYKIIWTHDKFIKKWCEWEPSCVTPFQWKIETALRDIEISDASLRLYIFLTEIQDYIYYSSETGFLTGNHIFLEEPNKVLKTIWWHLENTSITAYQYLILFFDRTGIWFKKNLRTDYSNVNYLKIYFSFMINKINKIMNCEQHKKEIQEGKLRNCKEEENYAACMSDLNEKNFCIAVENAHNLATGELVWLWDDYVKLDVIKWLLDNSISCNSKLFNDISPIKIDEETLKNTNFCLNTLRISSTIQEILTKFHFTFETFMTEWLAYEIELVEREKSASLRNIYKYYYNNWVAWPSVRDLISKKS